MCIRDGSAITPRASVSETEKDTGGFLTGPRALVTPVIRFSLQKASQVYLPFADDVAACCVAH